MATRTLARELSDAMVVYSSDAERHIPASTRRFGMTDQRITQSDRADLVAALSRFGCHRRFPRNKEIYAEDDPADCWFMVVSGTVRICKLLVGRRRHIAEFCFPDDCFGLDRVAQRLYSAEAVSEVVVMRYP